MNKYIIKYYNVNKRLPKKFEVHRRQNNIISMDYEHEW